MTFAKLTRGKKTTMPNFPNQNPILPRQAWIAPPESIDALITPINRQGQCEPSLAVEVRDLNQRSITFQHQLPLNNRRVLVVVDSPKSGRITAEVNLTWCRFHRSGGYTSGGRFVQQTKNIA